MQRTLERNYRRMTTVYGGPMDGAPLAGARLFTADGVYNKLTILILLAVATATYGYAAATPGIAFVAIIAAFVLGLVGAFRPRAARITGPLYAVLEGVGLGFVSAQYTNLAGGIVPVAILFTAGVFVATLFAYRTGLVKVTPRFMSMTIIATFGLALVFVASLFGLHLPGVDSLGTGGLIFGVVALGIAVMNLFIDFAFIDRGVTAQLDADAEWYAAFSMMLSLVLVYLSVLRIIASQRRR